MSLLCDIVEVGCMPVNRTVGVCFLLMVFSRLSVLLYNTSCTSIHNRKSLFVLYTDIHCFRE